MKWYSLLGLFIAPVAFADQIQLLDRGDQSLAAFYSVISSAGQSLDMATFIFEPCESAPKLLLDAMVKKAKSGVRVRLMIDAYSFKEPNKSGLAAYLATIPRFELRYYNDSPTLLTANGRSHIKLLVADGRSQNRSLIIGGRNISDDYFGLSPKMNYVDQDLLARGGMASVAQAQFEELWAASSPVFASGDARAFASSCLASTARDKQVADLIVAKGPGILAARPVRACKKVELALDKPGFETCDTCDVPLNDPENDGLVSDRIQKKRMTALFLDFVGGTQSRLELANQYYMPWYGVNKAFAELRSEGKIVEVFSNSTGDIDLPSRNQSFSCYLQSAAFMDSRGSERVSLLSSRGSMSGAWALSFPHAQWRIHTKSAVRDGRDVLVSSFNIDPRSYNTNLESGLVAEDCSELAGDVSAQYNLLRGFLQEDKNCSGCKADFVPANRTMDNTICGGEPLFY